jgi:hypothetical protein
MQHTVTIALLRSLARMAAEGVPANVAARRTGENSAFVRYWARNHHVSFAPMQNRGMPAWLLPEAARQAEVTLRATWERVRVLHH